MTIELATTYDLMLEQTELFLLRMDAMMRRTPVLRYGQAFINSFASKIKWPELFHEKDEAKARVMIREYMIDNQNAGELHVMMDTYEKLLDNRDRMKAKFETKSH